MFHIARSSAKRARSASMEVSVVSLSRRKNRIRRHKTADPASIQESVNEYQRQSSAPSELTHPKEEGDAETGKTDSKPVFDIKGDLVKEFNPTTKFDRNEALISGVTFSPVGDLCVADSANGKIKLFDANGSLKVECTIPKRRGSNMRPHGLDVMSKGNIVASDKAEQNLKIFTPFGRLYNTIEFDCGNLGKLCTYGDDKVAVIDDDNRNVILVSNTDNRSVTTLSVDQSGNALFKVPYDVISVRIDEKHLFLITDIREKKLLFVDPNKKESKNSTFTLEEPYGLAKLPTGGVLIADKGSNQIIQVTGASLEESKTLLGPDHGLDSPIMVTASSRGYLAVVEDDRACVKLFR